MAKAAAATVVGTASVGRSFRRGSVKTSDENTSFLKPKNFKKELDRIIKRYESNKRLIIDISQLTEPQKDEVVKQLFLELGSKAITPELQIQDGKDSKAKKLVHYVSQRETVKDDPKVKDILRTVLPALIKFKSKLESIARRVLLGHLQGADKEKLRGGKETRDAEKEAASTEFHITAQTVLDLGIVQGFDSVPFSVLAELYPSECESQARNDSELIELSRQHLKDVLKRFATAIETTEGIHREPGDDNGLLKMHVQQAKSFDDLKSLAGKNYDLSKSMASYIKKLIQDSQLFKDEDITLILSGGVKTAKDAKAIVDKMDDSARETLLMVLEHFSRVCENKDQTLLDADNLATSVSSLLTSPSIEAIEKESTESPDPGVAVQASLKYKDSLNKVIALLIKHKDEIFSDRPASAGSADSGNASVDSTEEKAGPAGVDMAELTAAMKIREVSRKLKASLVAAASAGSMATFKTMPVSSLSETDISNGWAEGEDAQGQYFYNKSHGHWYPELDGNQEVYYFNDKKETVRDLSELS